MNNLIIQATQVLQTGGIIAYPTEAVYGLGCDPLNELAVKKLLQLKQRPLHKGLILIAANWEQVQQFIAPVQPEILARAFATWPGPVTWVFPASKELPSWIRGQYDAVAVRITAHALAKNLCEQFGGALVSTSANLADSAPAHTAAEVQMIFPTGIDFIIPGEVGNLEKLTDLISVKLKNNPTKLDLSYEGLTEEGVSHVLMLLKQCAPINHLCLEGNPISDRGAQAVIQYLATNPELTYLNLSGCQIDFEGLCAITDFLEKNFSINVIFTEIKKLKAMVFF